MNILILTTWLAPYRIDLYNELAKQANVTVLYADTSTPERNKDWKAKMSARCNYMKMNKGMKFPIIGNTCPEFINKLRHNIDSFDIVYVDGYASIGHVQAINYMSKHRINYFVNVDGALIRENESLPIKLFKKWILKRDCYYLCGAKITNLYLQRYGVNETQIYNHPFTSLFRKDIIDKPINLNLKMNYREELNLKEPFIILSVGRFSYKNGYGKGYDTLIKTAARMSKDFGFYIIGDEPTQEFVNLRNELRAYNVHFEGFKQKEELKKYYQAADVFVLMTIYDVWGLVINEAMSNGLPVITTDMCVAGLDLIKDGENGFVISVGDSDALQRCIWDIYKSDKYAQMQNNAIATIREYTIENLAQTHIKIFKKYLHTK